MIFCKKKERITMSKEELLDELENGMTVGELIEKLSKFDKNMLVVNTRCKEKLPVNDVEITKIDYCYDEIISREVVSIF